MCDVEDEELMDDPISLTFEGFPDDNVQNSSRNDIVEDDVEDDPISLIINPNEKYIVTDIIEIPSSDDENEEQHSTPKSGYGNKNFIIPVTFLDFYRNVKLLKKCKPLSIKVVDCDKHPWYYGKRGASKSTVNVNCLTLGKQSNVIKQEIKVEKADEDPVTLENEGVNAETLATTSQSLHEKAQDQGKTESEVNSVMLIPRTVNGNCEKLESEPAIAKKSKNSSQVDYKRNSGLVGLTISKKYFDLNLDKVTKNLDSNQDKVITKKTRKKRKKENIINNNVLEEIGVALSNLGTSVTPVPEDKNDNVLESKTKDSHASSVHLHGVSSSSNFSDKTNNETVSPTRCSLKITSSKILEKVIQLKKAKSRDASKAKPQQKPKKIFEKDHAVPKLNLKRRPTTESDEFYIVNSNNSFSLSELSQSQEPQKDKNAVENVIQKKKSDRTCPPIVPSITITVKNQQTFTPKSLKNAEKVDQAQTRAALPTPKSYHNKLKLNKNKNIILNNAPNKIIQNEPITSICPKIPNNQDLNASDSSLTSGLNEVVVTKVQSLRNMNTLSPNRPTPEKTAIYLSKPKDFKLKRTENIDTAAADSKLNVNENNENLIRNGNMKTHGPKTKKSEIHQHQLQQTPQSFLQVYNAHLLNYYNSLKDRVTKPDKSDPEILKETKNNATEHNQMLRPKDTVTVKNNNLHVTNYDVPNRDIVTSNGNLKNATIPPLTTVNIKRFNDQKQLDEYLYMKRKQSNTQLKPTDTVNNILPINTQVYNRPGNNTVILRKPPAHISTGLPIQTVVNHRPTNIPKPSAETFSPWSFPPPKTNVASNVHNYSTPNTNFYSENQMYPYTDRQYYWQVTNSGNPCLPPSPLVVQQGRHSNLIPVKRKISHDSVIGSTGNGELIKKINIGVPASDSTVVNDKQKMLDTLNDAINEQIDFLPKVSDPRTLSQTSRPKPCPLSKKPKINPKPNIEPSKGYSPPILPIPSFQKAIELAKQKVHDLILSQVEKMDNIDVNTNSIDKYDHRSVQDISKKKKPTIGNKKQDKTKKISLEEYKKRVSKDDVDANKVPKHKCKRKKVSKNIVVDNNQDLGYDSDATMKL